MKGSAGDVALARLLTVLGQSATAAELRHQGGARAEAEGLQRELHARSLVARVVSVDLAALRTISVPCLVQLEDGGWVVARERRRSRLMVDAEDGSRYVTARELHGHVSGVGIEVMPPLPLPGSLWKGALGIVARERAILGAAAAALAIQLCALLTPQLTRLALDRALPQGAGSLLNAIALGLLLVGAFQAWITWLRQRTILFLRTGVQVLVERGFLDHLLRLPFPALQGRTVGDLMQAMSALSAVRTLCTEKALGVVLDGMTSVLYLAVMAASMPGPAAAVALAALAAFGASVLGGRAQAAERRTEIRAQARQHAFLIESLSGIETVKGMGAERHVLRRWLELMLDQLTAGMRRQRLGIWTDLVLESARKALTVVVLVWGGRAALGGEVSLGTFMAFVQMSTGFLAAVVGLASTVVVVLVLRPQLAPTAELARIAREPRRPPGGARGRAAGGIVLDDVWFRYDPAAPWVFSGYGLRVDEGEKRWIKGPSGWGKSTLLRLLCGLYVPAQGRVSVCGRDPVESRGSILYLPQFVHLYAGSILDNLGILSGHAPRERILEAAEASGLHEFVRRLPMGYETVVPPGAGSLSGGQRQLIALAAAMASDRAVMLLDEAFANLDWLSRSWLADSPWFTNRTLVYVSHDTRIGS